MEYVSLHHHSTLSYGDGFGLPEEHVARAAELGMTALALTEHGNVSSHIKLEKAALKHGIKPIFGLEAYTGPADMRETANMRKWHQTILAMDLQGLSNLYALVTRSWAEGFYRWPTILGSWYRELGEGLIVTSGCLDGKIACDLLGGKGRDVGSFDDAVRTIRAFKALFGDRFYLEVQRFHQIERCRNLNPFYEEMGAKYGIELLATADCHYPYPEQNEMQKILHAASRGSFSVAEIEAQWEYDILLTHPTSDKEIYENLLATGLSRKAARRAVLNTAVVADRCNVELPKMETIKYPITREDFRPW